MVRSLASIRRVTKIQSIPNADNIELCIIDGWQVVTKKNELKEGGLCVYFEIDSFLPDTPKLEFLGTPKTHQGKQGHRLKTIKLRGQISQGLALPLSLVFTNTETLSEGDDVTDLLNVIKYDNSLIDNAPGLRAGNPAGKFPWFIPKTDQERIQNLVSYFEQHKDTVFEETLKLDGSSCTMYKMPRTLTMWDKLKRFFGFKVKPYHFGVCSRNLEIKPSENYSTTFKNDDKESEFKQSNFWYVAKKYRIENLLPKGYAVQGELIGPKIQANHEKVADLDFFVFDIYNIHEQRYLTPLERKVVMRDVLLGVNHVPTVNSCINIFQECESVSSLLARVKGASMNSGTISEGRVYKSLDGKVSFKCINNDYLLKCEQ